MTDRLAPEQRSYCMSCIRGRDTRIELQVASLLHRRGLRFRKHVSGLPGRPDIVFSRARVAVFIDGDFWHGYHFPAWREKVSAFWQKKIADTRDRDKRNFRKLRRMGWAVIRLWQHQVKDQPGRCVARIVAAVGG